jgi:hypothetical protein
MSGFDGFMESFKKLVGHQAKGAPGTKNPQFNSSAIEIDYSKAIAPHITALVLDFISETQDPMLQLIEVLGFDGTDKW